MIPMDGIFPAAIDDGTTTTIIIRARTVKICGARTLPALASRVARER